MPDAPLHALDLILRKRSGGDLTDAEIAFLVRAVVASGATRDLLSTQAAPHVQGSSPHISDAQLGALLMAIYQRGLDPRELATLTEAMRTSGEVFDPRTLDPDTPVVCVDKHSTGGVGDKTSLLIAPIVAAAGLQLPTPAGVPSICVPMISGRSLGHTGGTLDKLETIPGFNTQLSLADLPCVLRRCGAALIGQTPTLVPADRLLYAMRDHTGTVESPFLITASIMSKKLAESLNALVLDVKVGSGAFLPSLADARELATLMVGTGNRSGTRTVALLTAMDQPLGRFAGNWVEVAECVEILQGRPHPLSADLIDLSLTLAGWMLHLAGHPEGSTPLSGRALAERLLASGAAFEAWRNIVIAQGGDTSVFTDPLAHHRPSATRTLTALGDGFLAGMDCRQVGWAVQRLGAGRSRPGDPVSAHAGLEMHAKLGDALKAGQPVVTLFTEDPSLLNQPASMIRETLRLSGTPPPRSPLVHEIIAASTPRKLPRSLPFAGTSLPRPTSSHLSSCRLTPARFHRRRLLPANLTLTPINSPHRQDLPMAQPNSQYVPPPQNSRKRSAADVPSRAQIGIALGAGALAVWGLIRGSKTSASLAAIGGAFAYKDARPDPKDLNAQACFRVYASPEAAYKLWRDLAGLPRFMSTIKRVEDLGGGRSKWTALGPGDMPLTWTTQITDDQPGKRISWSSTEDSTLQTTGSVEFTPAPDGRGIFVTTESSFALPSGPLARTAMSVLGRNPEFIAREDLRKFKALLETGEIPTTLGQSHGPRGASGKLRGAAYRETSNLAQPGGPQAAQPAVSGVAVSGVIDQPVGAY